jgi:hypothetical protein
MQFVRDPVPANSPAATNPRAINRRPDWLLISTLAGTSAYLYLRLFSFHNVPFLLGGDQDYYWMNGMRLLAGEHIYQDFFRYLPPGTDYLYAALFRGFGSRIWVTNLTVLALGLAFAWVCSSLSVKLMSRSFACLATVVFMVFVYGKALNAFNYWFSILAIAAAVNLLMTGTNRARLAAGGVLLAVAAFFNQVNSGAALVAVCLFLLWKRFGTRDNSIRLVQDLGVLLLGFGIPLLLFNSYFIAQVGLEKLWYCQVTYVLKYPSHLSDTGSLGFAEPLSRSNFLKIAPYIPMYLLLPAVYCTAFWLCWFRRRTSFSRERAVLLCLVGFLLLAEVATAVNWLRLYSVSLPGVILFFWIIGDRLRTKSYVVIVLWVMTVGFGVQQVTSIHAANSVQATLPGGILATTPEYYEKLHWIAERTHPGEFFFQAGWPGVYLPLQLRNPLYIATLTRFDIPRADDIALSIQQFKSKPVPYILWTPLLDSACRPGLPCVDSISPIREYIYASYKCVHAFPDGETMWQRDE